MVDVEKFLSKVDKTETCWLWGGWVNKQGYGMFLANGKYIGAHRVSYELFVGSIPDGLVMDHLCRVHSCVNPAHLEAVTSRENTMRGMGPGAQAAQKTHCKNGHEFNEKNTRYYIDKKKQRNNIPRRRCRACDVMQKRAKAAKLKK